MDVVLEDGLAVARALRQADGARDHRLHHEGGEVGLHFLDDLAGELGTHVVHRHHDAADGELVGRARGLELIDDAEDLAEALHREVFGLQRHEQVVRGTERVHREHAERGRAVDEDGLVLAGGDERGEGLAHAPEVVLGLGQLRLYRGEVELGGNQVQLLGRSRDDHVGGLGLAVQDAVHRAAFRLLEAEGAGGVGLGVQVDEQGGEAEPGEPGRQVDGGGRLADAALLVRDGEDLRHLRRPRWGVRPRSAPRSRSRRRRNRSS